MRSSLALIGGEEFTDGFDEVHAQLADMAYRNRGTNNSRPLRVAFLPTCAANDGLETVEYWSEQARQRLSLSGANVSALQIIDRESADNPDNARRIAEADWVYIGGGYPHVGMSILSGTKAMEALRHAHKRGALISGASAGAMMMGARSWVITTELDRAINVMLSQGGNTDDFDIPIPEFLDCLRLVHGVLCWPHLNKFFSIKWVYQGMLPPGCTMIGIDEQTAVVSRDDNSWRVLGKGRAVIIDEELQANTYISGQQFALYPSTTKLRT